MDNQETTWADLDTANLEDGHYDREPTPLLDKARRIEDRLFQRICDFWNEIDASKDPQTGIPAKRPDYRRLERLTAAHARAHERVWIMVQYYDGTDCDCAAPGQSCQMCGTLRYLAEYDESEADA